MIPYQEDFYDQIEKKIHGPRESGHRPSSPQGQRNCLTGSATICAQCTFPNEQKRRHRCVPVSPIRARENHELEPGCLRNRQGCFARWALCGPDERLHSKGRALVENAELEKVVAELSLGTLLGRSLAMLSQLPDSSKVARACSPRLVMPDMSRSSTIAW
jgi:hypothetical protein